MAEKTGVKSSSNETLNRTILLVLLKSEFSAIKSIMQCYSTLL